MKKLTFLLFVVLTCAALATSQSADKHRFGDREVNVPAPDGFTNVIGRFTRITARTSATEDPGNDILAVHVPNSFVPKLSASEDIDLEFYTKVSTSKRVRPVEINAEFFKMVIADLEKNFGTYLDPDGQMMKKMEKNSEKGLAEIGSKTTVDLTSTRTLGFFEKTDRVFSGMSLLGMEIHGRKINTLATVSIIHVNQRMIYVYVYKMFPADSDVKDLTTFTKKWTAKVVAANKF